MCKVGLFRFAMPLRAWQLVKYPSASNKKPWLRGGVQLKLIRENYLSSDTSSQKVGM